jgi:hypothetical protein
MKSSEEMLWKPSKKKILPTIPKIYQKIPKEIQLRQ